MNNILKVALRANNLRSLLKPFKNVASIKTQQVQITRSLWVAANSRNDSFPLKHSHFCNCGCNSNKRFSHTKAERELVEFLTEEILAERKAQKAKTIPTKLEGFEARLDGAEVTLTKKDGDETIKITFNVNHTVDTDVEPQLNENLDKPDLGELKSKPNFRIDLVRGSTTLSLSCSIIGPNDQEEGYNDVFGIDEISIFEGEWNENVYSVTGEVVDSDLYDLILNYLEEKGITNEFVEKLCDYSTLYEHTAYIGLLEGLSKFVSGK